jgi:hypothetical protein
MKYFRKLLKEKDARGPRTVVRLLKAYEGAGKAEFASAGIDVNGEVQEAHLTDAIDDERMLPDVREGGEELSQTDGERLWDCIDDLAESIDRKCRLDERLAAILTPQA